MSSPMDDDDSYERQRLANIAENEALLRELGVAGGLSGRASKQRATTAEKPKKAAVTKKRKAPARAPEPAGPRRVSSRLAGLEADSEKLQRKYEEEAEALREAAEAARRAKHEDQSLSQLLGEASTAAEIEGLTAALAADAAETAKAIANGDAQPESASLSELRAVLERMELRASSKVVQKRVYSMAVHPRSSDGRGDLVFIGDKEGSIGVWEPLAPKAGGDDDEDAEAFIPEGQAWALQAHGKSPVTCLKVDPLAHRTLYSSSYDATVRALDLESGVSSEVWQGSEDVLLSIFEVLPGSGASERNLWVADHRGGLISVDRRMRSVESKRWQVCEKKIGGLSVNVARPHCVAVASLDQHIRLFDTRALATLPTVDEAPYNARNVDEDDLERAVSQAQIGASKARLACTSVDFSPRGDQLVGVSYDDVVKVWDMHPSWLSREATDGARTRSQRGTPRKASGSSSPAPKIARAKAPRANARASAVSTTAAEKEEEEDVKRPGLLRWLSRDKEEQEDKKPVAGEDDAAPSAAAIDADDGDADGPPRPQDVLESPRVIPHNNQTGKWLTLFRARWMRNADVEPHFTIGGMNRHAEIYDSSGVLLRSLYDADNITAVPAVTAMHPREMGRLATGNGSGRCTFWCPAPDSE